MLSGRSVAAFGLVVCVALSSSCGEPSPNPPDASRADAGPSSDGETDACTAPDAAGADTGSTVAGCALAWRVEVTSTAVARFDLATSPEGAAVLVWSEERDGASDLFARAVSPSGTVDREHRLTNDAATDRDPAARWRDDGVRIVWSRGEGGPDSYDLYGTRLDATGAAQTAPTVLGSADDVGDHLPVLASGARGDHDYVVWVRRRWSTGSDAWLARRRLQAGDEVGALEMLDFHASPARRPTPGRLDGQRVWAWVDASEDSGSVRVVIEYPLSRSLAGPLVLSSGAIDHLDLASGPNEVALVWDVEVSGKPEHAVRYRRLRSGGELGVERSLTLGATSGSAPSIAAIGGGYAALWSGATAGTRPHVHLAFLSSAGDAIGHLEIQPLRRPLTATALSAVREGLRAAWLEERPEGPTLTLARIDCGGS